MIMNKKRRIYKTMKKIFMICLALAICLPSICVVYLVGTDIYFSKKTEKYFHDNKDLFENIVELSNRKTYNSMMNNGYIELDDIEAQYNSELSKEEEEILGNSIKILEENNMSSMQGVRTDSHYNYAYEVYSFKFSLKERIFSREYDVFIIKFNDYMMDSEEALDWVDKMYSPTKMELVNNNWIILYKKRSGNYVPLFEN